MSALNSQTRPGHALGVAVTIMTYSRIPAAMQRLKKGIVGEAEQHADTEDHRNGKPPQPREGNQSSQDSACLVLLAEG